jgi:hypothetical protein
MRNGTSFERFREISKPGRLRVVFFGGKRLKLVKG